MSTIDDYLNSLPEHIRAPLENLRQLIRRTLPEALIAEMVAYSARENEAEAALKKKKKTAR